MTQPSPSSAAPSSQSTSDTLKPPSKPPANSSPAPDKFEHPESDASRASKQASEWNALLKWNRSTRLATGGGIDSGWDYATGMYQVPKVSGEYYSGVERDPNPPKTTTRHATSVTVSSGGDKDFELSGDEGGAGKGYHDSGRPKRSRQAMTRG
ncbi:uncharacterized protein JCM6883_004869 [Sporobolomyces salmoneus]|uniref:uncharacterized protein n=1 Tax=Sporobolomyces salmoneus TaxID=183962 RepID=UPI00317E4121